MIVLVVSAAQLNPPKPGGKTLRELLLFKFIITAVVCVCATKSGAMPLKPTKIHIIVRCDSTTLLVSVTFIPAVCEAIPKGALSLTTRHLLSGQLLTRPGMGVTAYCIAAKVH